MSDIQGSEESGVPIGKIRGMSYNPTAPLPLTTDPPIDAFVFTVSRDEWPRLDVCSGSASMDDIYSACGSYLEDADRLAVLIVDRAGYFLDQQLRNTNQFAFAMSASRRAVSPSRWVQERRGSHSTVDWSDALSISVIQSPIVAPGTHFMRCMFTTRKRDWFGRSWLGSARFDLYNYAQHAQFFGAVNWFFHTCHWQFANAQYSSYSVRFKASFPRIKAP